MERRSGQHAIAAVLDPSGDHVRLALTVKDSMDETRSFCMLQSDEVANEEQALDQATWGRPTVLQGTRHFLEGVERRGRVPPCKAEPAALRS